VDAAGHATATVARYTNERGVKNCSEVDGRADAVDTADPIRGIGHQVVRPVGELEGQLDRERLR